MDLFDGACKREELESSTGFYMAEVAKSTISLGKQECS